MRISQSEQQFDFDRLPLSLDMTKFLTHANLIRCASRIVRIFETDGLLVTSSVAQK